MPIDKLLSILDASEPLKEKFENKKPPFKIKKLNHHKNRKEFVIKAKYVEIWVLYLIQKNTIMNLKKLSVPLIITMINMKVLEIKMKH